MIEQVSDHFALHEFGQPAGFGCEAQDYPAELVRPCLTPPCLDVLEVVRSALGLPLVIIPAGGWRSPKYNAAKRAWEISQKGSSGTAIDSQHCYGKAADVRVQHVTDVDVHTQVLALFRAGKLPRLGGLGRYFRPGGKGWVHLDIRDRLPGAALVEWAG
jgi:uncharacterized protein YcbK (DUF882 family)